MKQVVFILAFIVMPLIVYAKVVKDTIYTQQNDQIILTYDIAINGDNVSIKVDNKPRIIPSDNLRKACKGDLGLLKVVLFDRVGDFGKVKWNGMSPTAFMVPSGLSYDKSNEGYYILGESTPVSFTKKVNDTREISFPLYVAVYEKKLTYKLVSSSNKPLKVSIGKSSHNTSHIARTGTETERIAIQSNEELEADNEDVARALSSMQMIRQLLASETEHPFSQTLQMELFNLRSLKDRVKDTDVRERINELLLQCNDKERELKDAQKEASLAAQTQELAMIAQQKAEQEALQKEADEKARIQEEKQQKRTLWMIIGGVILAILAFIGNAIFKHFRDIRNQKSIMEMQESLAKQAEHEASRRSKEIVRNKAHQMANKGRSKMKQSLQDTGKTKKNTKIKSI